MEGSRDKVKEVLCASKREKWGVLPVLTEHFPEFRRAHHLFRLLILVFVVLRLCIHQSLVRLLLELPELLLRLFLLAEETGEGGEGRRVELERRRILAGGRRGSRAHAGGVAKAGGNEGRAGSGKVGG